MTFARGLVTLAALLSFSCTSESTTTPDSRDLGTQDLGTQIDAQPDSNSFEDASLDAVNPTEDMTPDLMADMTADMTIDMGPVLRPIGPRPVLPTPVEQGTLFAAPDGTGDACTKEAPCDIYEVVTQAKAADVVFLRGGVHSITKNLSFRGANPPIVFEGYPGEEAILDGSTLGANDEVYIRLYDGPVALRRMTIRNMPKAGLSVRTSDNVLEGLTVYGNLLSGIHIHESYDTPTSNRNIIRDSVVYDNSGAGLMSAEYADGGNSDGISISSGIENRVENCLVYGNSDDGIDVWRTTDSYVGYSIIYGSGIASGNGQGVKAGGAAPSARAFVEHNLSYNNKAAGFDFNSGVGVTFRHNTSWNNRSGYSLGNDTLSTKNIAFENSTHNDRGDQNDNSWQRTGTPTPLSTDPNSADFLVPAGGEFSDLGAYADRE